MIMPTRLLSRAKLADALPPMRVLEVELGAPVEPIAAGQTPAGDAYASARVLIRLHGAPLGTVEVSLANGDVAPEDLLARVLAELSQPIREHLSLDDVAVPIVLPISGLAQQPGCRSRPQLPAEPGLVTVVVATMGPPELLSRCLDSVLASDHPNFELLVVDSRPAEAIIEPMLTRLYGDNARVRYVQEPQPGLSRARNTGLLFARGDVVVFADDDVTVDQQWLRSVASEFENDETVACVVGLTQPAELNTAPQIYFDRCAHSNNGFTRRVLSISESQGSAFADDVWSFSAGAGMGLRRSLLGDLWAFDVSLGEGSLSRGGEEFDSRLELFFAGQKIVYQPRMLAWHWYDESYEDLLLALRSLGMGRGAVFAKQLLTSRRSRLKALRREPHGLRLAFGIDQSRGMENAEACPRDLALQELIGFVNGPFAYIHSRLRLAWLSS